MGVGRHLLGSQIFDYWRDPWGQRPSITLTGTCSTPPSRQAITSWTGAGLYQWGPDLPDNFVDAKLTPRQLVNVLKMAVSDKARQDDPRPCRGGRRRGFVRDRAQGRLYLPCDATEKFAVGGSHDA